MPIFRYSLSFSKSITFTSPFFYEGTGVLAVKHSPSLLFAANYPRGTSKKIGLHFDVHAAFRQ